MSLYLFFFGEDTHTHCLPCAERTLPVQGTLFVLSSCPGWVSSQSPSDLNILASQVYLESRCDHTVHKEFKASMTKEPFSHHRWHSDPESLHPSSRAILCWDSVHSDHTEKVTCRRPGWKRNTSSVPLLPEPQPQPQEFQLALMRGQQARLELAASGLIQSRF